MRIRENAAAAVLFFLGLLLTACGNFEKPVDVKLPPFQSQLVIESYIQKNDSIRVAVMETQDYFSPAKLPFINDATVVLRYGTKSYTLKLNPKINLQDLKYFNYILEDSLPLRPGDRVHVEVMDKKGRTASAETQWMDPVKIDSINYQYNSEGKAYVVANFHDPVGRDYYRFRAHRVNDTSYDRGPDYFADDAIFDGQKTNFGTEFRFKKGDTVEVTLYHLTKEYYDFLSTASAASDANGNPFAQPAIIKSNVIGGTGIFTVLPFDRRIFILP